MDLCIKLKCGLLKFFFFFKVLLRLESLLHVEQGKLAYAK